MRFILIFLLSLSNAFSCSIFKGELDSKPIVAKNFDWSTGVGEIIIRPRNALKVSLETKEKWISKYGSVTFSQFGPDLPIGGINDHGLIVEALVVSQKMYKSNSNKTLLNEAEWIQYQLDRYRTIDEVINNINKFIVKPHYINSHYFVCDQSGECIVVEFINSIATIYKDSTLPYSFLTNTPYLYAINNLDNTNADFSASAASLKRFSIFENQNFSFQEKKSIYINLDKVKIASYTKWQYFYDLDELKINFKYLPNKNTLNIDLKDLSFNCENDIKAISFHQNHKDFSNLKIDLASRLKHEKVSENIKQILLSKKLINNCVINHSAF